MVAGNGETEKAKLWVFLWLVAQKKGGGGVFHTQLSQVLVNPSLGWSRGRGIVEINSAWLYG